MKKFMMDGSCEEASGFGTKAEVNRALHHHHELTHTQSELMTLYFFVSRRNLCRDLIMSKAR